MGQGEADFILHKARMLNRLTRQTHQHHIALLDSLMNHITPVLPTHQVFFIQPRLRSGGFQLCIQRVSAGFVRRSMANEDAQWTGDSPNLYSCRHSIGRFSCAYTGDNSRSNNGLPLRRGELLAHPLHQFRDASAIVVELDDIQRRYRHRLTLTHNSVVVFAQIGAEDAQIGKGAAGDDLAQFDQIVWRGLRGLSGHVR